MALILLDTKFQFEFRAAPLRVGAQREPPERDVCHGMCCSRSRRRRTDGSRVQRSRSQSNFINLLDGLPASHVNTLVLRLCVPFTRRQQARLLDGSAADNVVLDYLNTSSLSQPLPLARPPSAMRTRCSVLFVGFGSRATRAYPYTAFVRTFKYVRPIFNGQLFRPFDAFVRLQRPAPITTNQSLRHRSGKTLHNQPALVVFNLRSSRYTRTENLCIDNRAARQFRQRAQFPLPEMTALHVQPLTHKDI
ncbi:hypothetical protein QTP88_005608 [Uroleucon formosanum]